MTFQELTEHLLLHAHTKMEIAELVGRHGNAPKYLYEQCQEHAERAVIAAKQLDLLTGLLK